MSLEDIKRRLSKIEYGASVDIEDIQKLIAVAEAAKLYLRAQIECDDNRNASYPDPILRDAANYCFNELDLALEALEKE